jgi:hypothetical protein
MEDLMCLHSRPPAQHSLNVPVADARIAHHRPTNQRSELAISLRRTQLRRQSLHDIETVSEAGWPRHRGSERGQPIHHHQQPLRLPMAATKRLPRDNLRRKVLFISTSMKPFPYKPSGAHRSGEGLVIAARENEP